MGRRANDVRTTSSDEPTSCGDQSMGSSRGAATKQGLCSCLPARAKSMARGRDGSFPIRHVLASAICERARRRRLVARFTNAIEPDGFGRTKRARSGNAASCAAVSSGFVRDHSRSEAAFAAAWRLSAGEGRHLPGNGGGGGSRTRVRRCIRTDFYACRYAI